MATHLTQDEVKALYESFTSSFLSPFAADEMFQTMNATGRSQFSLEEIHSFVEQASGRAAEAHYQELLKENPEIAEQLKAEEAEAQERAQWAADENAIDRVERSLYEAAQPTSWEEVTEDLEGFPELKDNSDMEMEL